MQSGQSSTSTASTNLIQIQPQNQKNSQFVSLNNQLVFSHPATQYIAVQQSGFQLLPVQNTNSGQFIHLQLQNAAQGGSYILKSTPDQNIQIMGKSIGTATSTQQAQSINNQKFNNVMSQGPIRLVQPTVKTTSNGSDTLKSQIDPSIQTVVTNSMLSAETTNVSSSSSVSSSTLFHALKQAGNPSGQSSESKKKTPPKQVQNISRIAVNKNPIITTKTLLGGQQRAFVVVSNANKPSFIIPKNQTSGVVQQNPVYVPITIANNLSILTNHTPSLLGSKNIVQVPQAAVMKIQQQIAPKTTTDTTDSNTCTSSQNQNKGFVIQPNQSSVFIQSNTQQQHGSFVYQSSNNQLPVSCEGNQTDNNIQSKDVKSGGANPKTLRMPGSITDTKPLKKPCNCTKSQCLKLYCECFANGEFCNNCNCRSCLNNIEYESERGKAIKACLERNPHAFHPKIGKGKVKGDNERRHTKGCNCKRSGCLKNYCECYEAKILCSSLCRCSGCKNFEESADRKTLMHLADAAEVCVQQQNAAKSKLTSQMDAVSRKGKTVSKERLPVSFLTADVSKATCEYLIAKAIEAESDDVTPGEIEKEILVQFSRCLDQIIDKSKTVKKEHERRTKKNTKNRTLKFQK